MSEGKDAFIEVLKGLVNSKAPTAEQIEEAKRVTDIAQNYYMNMRDGKIADHVTTTVILFAREVLPELSMTQVKELNHAVHTTIGTVLSYLVEDGLIKEE